MAPSCLEARRSDRDGVMDGCGLDRQAQRPCGVLDGAQHQGRERRGGGIEDDRNAGHLRRDLRQHLQPFAGQRTVVIGKAGEVAAGMRQVFDKALADGIGDDGEHDRDRRGAPAQLFYRGGADRKQDVGLERDQLVGELRDAGAVAAAVAPIDLEVVALLPALAGERFDQGHAARLADRIIGSRDREHAEPSCRVRLLRHRRGRQRREHPKKRQAPAAVHGTPIRSSPGARAAPGCGSRPCPVRCR